MTVSESSSGGDQHDDEWFDPDGWKPTPNRLARDGGPGGLSFEARGMFTYLASHSSEWQTRMRDLEREGNCGRERARRILGELIDAGYVIRSRQQAKPGGPIEWVYQVNPSRSVRVTGFPTIGIAVVPDDQGDDADQGVLLQVGPSDGFSDDRVSRPTGSPTDGKPVDIENTISTKHLSTREDEPKPKRPAATDRGCRIPDDFHATPSMIEWARKNTPLVGKAETEQFIDYWHAASGANSVKKDWVAAWRFWMRTEQKRAGQRGGRHLQPVPDAPPPSDPDAAFSDIRDRTDAVAAAKLLGTYWPKEVAQPPRDPLPYQEFARRARIAFIEENADAIREALARRHVG